MQEHWRAIGGALEGWRRIGGRLEEDWRMSGGGLGVFKMAENHEKQLFTFWGFLPPYFGVSGFPAYPKRQILTRSIDWYKKFFISCLVARYWKIYRKSIEHLSKIYRKSIENLSNIYRTSIEHLSKIYRTSIENLSNIYRTSIDFSNIEPGGTK